MKIRVQDITNTYLASRESPDTRLLADLVPRVGPIVLDIIAKPFSPADREEVIQKDEVIFACMQLLIDAVIQNYYLTVDGKMDNSNAKVKKIKEYLEHPQRRYKMLMRNILMTFLIHGDSFFQVDGLFVLARGAELVRAVIDEDTKQLKMWQFKQFLGTWTDPIDIMKVVHLSALHYDWAAIYGNSNIDVLKRTIMTKWYADALNADRFVKKGIPPYVFVLKEGSQDDYNRMKDEVSEEEAGTNIVLRGDVDIKPLAGNFPDEYFNNLLRFMREKIVSVFIRDPSMIGIHERSVGVEDSRSSRNGFKLLVKALQDLLNEAMDEWIWKMFGENFADVKWHFVPWHDDLEYMQLFQRELDYKIKTINEVRFEMGLEPVSWGDEPQLPLSQSGGNEGGGGGPKKTADAGNTDKDTGRPSRDEGSKNASNDDEDDDDKTVKSKK